MEAGTKARVLRGNGVKTIEDDWTVLREENDLVLLEKGAAHISVPRAEFDRLNFPGADAVVRACGQVGCIDSFVNGDLSGVRASLVRFMQTLDPAFSGAEDATSLEVKITLRIASIESSVGNLKRDMERAQHEYDHFVGRTALDNDRKDNLLTRVRNFEDQLATRQHELTELVPGWQNGLRALKALDSKT